MVVCQKCGDEGDVKRLVYCIKCKVSVEHSYCLDILPRKGNKRVVWTCEECTLRDAKPCSIPLIKSARINQNAKIRLDRIKTLKQATFSRMNAEANRDKDGLNAQKPMVDSSCSPKIGTERMPSCDYSLKEKIEKPPTFPASIESEVFRKPKRRLILEDGNSDEDSEPVKHSEADPSFDACSLNISYRKADDYIDAQPITDPIWRGSLSIKNKSDPITMGLVAHLSSKACTEVCDAAKQLPMQLNAAVFSRSDAWPRKFEIAPPTDESIALYFFPAYERDEKVFDSLITHMNSHKQALKVVVNNVELLVFSSCELPLEQWRFCMKYYLWGVFKTAKNPTPEISVKSLQRLTQIQ